MRSVKYSKQTKKEDDFSKKYSVVSMFCDKLFTRDDKNSNHDLLTTKIFKIVRVILSYTQSGSCAACAVY